MPELCPEYSWGPLKGRGYFEAKVSLISPNIKFKSAEYYGRDQVGKILAPLKKYEILPVSAEGSPSMNLLKTLGLYWPLILLFLLSAGIPALQAIQSGFGIDQWMYRFMGIILVALSYFKLLNLPKFAQGFSTYDPIAKRFHGYGYVYPFLELLCGIAFLMTHSIQLISGSLFYFCRLPPMEWFRHWRRSVNSNAPV
ncbi:MAG: hypothetical protein IPK68_22195 [Bdellovibrionales bacterium]|nr:hypothetical protein [Bdellovibrionales bacterium]